MFGGFPTWSAKLAALKEPFVGRGPEDESVADFGRRRLGAGLFEQVMDPMVTGVYAASPERLSVRSAFPRIKNMEGVHGSLFRGMLAARKARSRTPVDQRAGSGSYSFLGGMTDLVEALSGALAGPLRREEPVRSLERSGNQWILRGRSRTSKFDHVVLAVPAHQLSGIDGIPVELRQDLFSVPYNPVAVVGLGYRREQVAHPLDGFGFLVPRSENRRILGTLFSSSLWPHAAPEGHVLVRSMVGGGRQPELAGLPVSELTDLVHSEMRDILGAQGDPAFVHVRSYAQGIPEYPVGHHDTLRRLRARMEGTGLHLAGNAWDGIGLNDCVAAALPRARALLA
jgi:oxygen-dependent protoporphyrinogen oxidase